MAFNPVDAVVSFFNPQAGLRRAAARQVLQRAYEGASRKDGWKPRRAGASANTDHRADAAELRSRARALVQNCPYITRGVGSMVANVVGTGIMPRSTGKSAAKLNDLWQQWCAVADADGVRDLWGLQAAAYRAMEVDGEVLLRLRARRPSDGLPVPLQIQLLEIDMLDTFKTGSNGPNTIINGIEYDPLGKRVAYWLWDVHPGETGLIRGSRTASKPVPAERVIHLFNPERPGQGRGITRLAPVISRARDLQVYEDAEAQRKNMESRLAVLASGDVNTLGPTSQHDDRSPEERSATGNLGSLAGGQIIEVPPGLNITTVQPNAVPGYTEYVRLQLHLIAAGMGVTYEMLTGDVSEVNFSSARVGMLEYRRNAEQLQWHTLIPLLCVPLWRAFVDAAYLAGAISTVDYSVAWSTPKWSYVNPVQDVAADLDEIGGGLCSLSEKIRQRGYVPDEVYAEIKSDFDRLQKDGTLDFLLLLQRGRTVAMSQAQATQPNQGGKAQK